MRDFPRAPPTLSLLCPSLLIKPTKLNYNPQARQPLTKNTVNFGRTHARSLKGLAGCDRPKVLLLVLRQPHSVGSFYCFTPRCDAAPGYALRQLLFHAHTLVESAFLAQKRAHALISPRCQIWSQIFGFARDDKRKQIWAPRVLLGYFWVILSA